MLPVTVIFSQKKCEFTVILQSYPKNYGQKPFVYYNFALIAPKILLLSV